MIIAVDPGLTTGWATWDAPHHAGFQSGMVEGRHAFYEWLYGLLSAYYAVSDYTTPQVYSAMGRMALPFQFVVEKFTITTATAQKSPQPDPLYIIGHLDAIAHRDGIPLDFQLPSQAMSFATNDKLKLIGWYKPGKGHDNDAARHLLLWMVRYPPPGSLLLGELAVKLGIRFGTDAPQSAIYS